MSNIIALRPPTSPYDAMDEARRRFLTSFHQWVQQNPDAQLIRDEVASLEGALLGISLLYGRTDGR